MPPVSRTMDASSRIGFALALLLTMSASSAVFAEDPGVEVVEVRYEETGKILALVPVTFTATARAHARGTITLRYPWYSVFTLDRQDKILAELKVAVDSALRERLVGSVVGAGEPPPRKKFSAEEAQVIAAAMDRVLAENFGTGIAEEGLGINRGTKRGRNGEK